MTGKTRVLNTNLTSRSCSHSFHGIRGFL